MPLARMSVSIRRVCVLLRITLFRRLAELSFRGHAFVDLPREVVQEVHRDVDGICDAVATPLAELFSFLRQDNTQCADMENAELALYAEPAFWRYGLLSFCVNACMSKTRRKPWEVPPRFFFCASGDAMCAWCAGHL